MKTQACFHCLSLHLLAAENTDVPIIKSVTWVRCTFKGFLTTDHFLLTSLIGISNDRHVNHLNPKNGSFITAKLLTDIDPCVGSYIAIYGGSTSLSVTCSHPT